MNTVTNQEELSLLERYMKEVGEDVKVDVFTMKDVQMKLPAIKHKWVARLIQTKLNIQRLQKKKEQLKRQAIEQLKNSAAYRVSDVQLEKAVEDHELLTKVSEDIKELNLIVDFLERVEKIFSAMSYDLRNLTEISKLETM